MYKPITTAAATALSQLPWFQGGGEAPYSLYMGVPLGALEDEGVPFRLDDSMTLDLLVCRGERQEAVLAVMLAPGPDLPHLNETFDSYLRGLDYLILRAEADPPQGKQDDICEALCLYVDDKLSQPMPPRPRPRRFTLPVRAPRKAEGRLSKVLRSYSPQELDRLLVRRQLLLKEGHITQYGRSCGLFLRYAPGEATWEPVTDKGMVPSVNEALFPPRPPRSGRASLARRLERTEDERPSDGRYSAWLTRSLSQLLDTPLTGLDGSPDNPLSQSLGLAEYWLDRLPAPDLYDLGAHTYGDALRTVHDLLVKEIATPFSDEARRKNYSNACMGVLEELAYQLLSGRPSPDREDNPSLRARLNRVRRSEAGAHPLLRVPLSHYLHAAAARAGSDYPLWLGKTLSDRSCRHIHRPLPRPERGKPLDLASLLKWYIRMPEVNIISPGSAVEFYGPFWCLYDLLVEPILPDTALEKIEGR